MSKNVLAPAQKTLVDYSQYMKQQPLEWYEQLDSRYPWILDQLERLRDLLVLSQGDFCPWLEKIEKKRIARTSLSEFVLKFQAMYQAMHPHKELPRKFQREIDETSITFYQRFIKAVKEDTEILGMSYVTNIASYHELKEALKDYEYYSQIAVFPRNLYSELSALTRSLQAFFVLVQGFEISQEAPPLKRKKPSRFIRWMLKKEK